MRLAVGKGSLQRAANAAGKGQKKNVGETKESVVLKEKEAAQEKGKAAKTPRKKSVKKQSIYLATVPAEFLQDIPDTWRGPRYVRPNVSALAESISKHGILEPVPAVQIGENTYQIVGGSKRMQVVQMLGIEQVPVLVLPTSMAARHMPMPIPW